MTRSLSTTLGVGLAGLVVGAALVAGPARDVVAFSPAAAVGAMQGMGAMGAMGGMGNMGAMGDMAAMHGAGGMAMDQAQMDELHARMLPLMPEDLRAACDANHQAMRDQHDAHHAGQA